MQRFGISICQPNNIFKNRKRENTDYLRFLINRHMTSDKQNKLMCDISCQLSLSELLECIFLITNTFYEAYLRSIRSKMYIYLSKRHVLL